MGLPRADHPIHTMVLPSTNQKVKFRPYLVKEEKILLMAAETTDESQMVDATKRVLENCILDEEFDVNEMSIFDMQYAFVQLRAKSVGEIADLKVVCKHCSHPNDYKLNFNELIIEIPEDLDYRIPLSGSIGVTMQFPKVGILDLLAKKDMAKTENSIMMIMACIKNIWDAETVSDPSKESITEQTAFIESLGRQDMEKLEAFTSKIPAISKRVEFKCSECGEHNERDIGGMSDFF